MLTNTDIYRIATAQSAVDLGCSREDFDKTTPVVVDYVLGPGARVYYKEPITCNLVSYGNNVVAAAKPEVRDVVETYVGKFEFYHLFETPHLHWLMERLEQQGHKPCYMAYYFLPDVGKLVPLDCPYELRLLQPADFAQLYLPQWSNALMECRKELDMLACGAYDGDTLVGLAGCSADCESMWQIGVDVLPAYRRQGVASALTSRLALAILERGKVPFYCCAWSNIRSAKNAVRCGFTPAWVEMTVKPAAFVDKINGE